MLRQKDNTRMDGGYDTMPSALFFALIALNGEWALVDFTWVGQIVCVGMCVCAIGMFSVPAGIFFEGFEDILEARQEAKVTWPLVTPVFWFVLRPLSAASAAFFFVSLEGGEPGLEGARVESKGSAGVGGFWEGGDGVEVMSSGCLGEFMR